MSGESYLIDYKIETKRSKVEYYSTSSHLTNLPYYFIKNPTWHKNYRHALMGVDIPVLSDDQQELVCPLDNNESIKNLQTWIEKADNDINEKLSDEEKFVMIRYMSNDYYKYWKFFEDESYNKLRDHWPVEMLTFSGCFEKGCQKHLPIGTILFEGQGMVEDDFSRIKKGDLRPGFIMNRKRPTSTSWHPNSALEFVSNDNRRNPILLVHTIDNENIQALLLETSAKDSNTECEILLQPELEIKITSLAIRTLSCRNPNRIGLTKPTIDCTVIYTKIKRLLR